MQPQLINQHWPAPPCCKMMSHFKQAKSATSLIHAHLEMLNQWCRVVTQTNMLTCLAYTAMAMPAASLVCLQRRACGRNGCALKSLSMLWGMWAGLDCVRILLQWYPPSGAVEMETVKSALVLLSRCKMKCKFFFIVKTCLCALSEEVFIPFFPFLPVLFCGGPWHFACLGLVRLSLISFLNGTTSSAISSQTLWLFCWLAKTSDTAISLNPWSNPNLKTYKLHFGATSLFAFNARGKMRNSHFAPCLLVTFLGAGAGLIGFSWSALVQQEKLCALSFIL